MQYRAKYTVNRKTWHTFVTITLENVDGFLITCTHLETGMNALCEWAIYIFWSLTQQRVYETRIPDTGELQQRQFACVTWLGAVAD